MVVSNFLNRSQQELAGYTREIGLGEKGENEPPAAPLYLTGALFVRETAVFGVLK
jgi:hypothetical protein